MSTFCINAIYACQCHHLHSFWIQQENHGTSRCLEVDTNATHRRSPPPWFETHPFSCYIFQLCRQSPTNRTLFSILKRIQVPIKSIVVPSWTVTAETLPAKSSSNCTHSVWLLSAAIWRAVMPPSAALFTILARELQQNPHMSEEVTDGEREKKKEHEIS